MEESTETHRIDIDTPASALALDGVMISLSVLRQLVRPDEGSFYQFARRGPVVYIKRLDAKDVLVDPAAQWEWPE